MIYCFDLHFPHYIDVEHMKICLLVTGILGIFYVLCLFYCKVVYLCNIDL